MMNAPLILNLQQLQYPAQLRKEIIKKCIRHVSQNDCSLKRRLREAQAPIEMKLNLEKIVDQFQLLVPAGMKLSLRYRDLVTTMLTIS